MRRTRFPTVMTAPMTDIYDIVFTWCVGVITGFIVSIPVGPINVTIINEGARRGFRWGVLIGLGAVLMEMIYCAFSFAGFSRLFENRIIRAITELASFLVMLILGWKYMIAKTVPEHNLLEERIEDKLHPSSAFMIGFVRVLANPAVLLFWIAMAATFIGHGWVEANWPSKMTCVAGVGAGAFLWFLLLSYAVSRGHQKFSTRTLLRMSRVSGLFLLLVAAGIGFRIVVLVARSKNAA